MKRVLSFILTCMLIVELVLLIIWILAYCGLSPIPSTPTPMQFVSLIVLIIGSAVALRGCKR